MEQECEIRGSSEIDRTKLLQFFFQEYTQSIINGENSAWATEADSAVQYMNDMRVAKLEMEMRQSIKDLFGDVD